MQIKIVCTEKELPDLVIRCANSKSCLYCVLHEYCFGKGRKEKRPLRARVTDIDENREIIVEV